MRSLPQPLSPRRRMFESGLAAILQASATALRMSALEATMEPKL